MSDEWHHHFQKIAYVHRISVGALVVDQNDKLLLVKEGREYDNEIVDSLVLPGGTLEKGETLVQGVIRETKEETNLEIKPFGIVGMTNWKRSNAKYPTDPYIHQGTDIILVSRLVGGEFRPQIEENIISVVFLTMKELEKLIPVDLNHPFKPKNELINIAKMYQRYLVGTYLPLVDVSGENYYEIRHEYV